MNSATKHETMVKIFCVLIQVKLEKKQNLSDNVIHLEIKYQNNDINHKTTINKVRSNNKFYLHQY